MKGGAHSRAAGLRLAPKTLERALLEIGPFVT
jgi:hypothetical protein